MFAQPSTMPANVPRESTFLVFRTQLPRSHSIAAIRIAFPISIEPKRNRLAVSQNSEPPSSSGFYHARQATSAAELIVANMKSGDLTGSKSDVNPSKIFPKKEPVSNQLKISIAVASS